MFGVRRRTALTESEKIEFLGGQVHALMGFAIAVITSHPNLAYLADNLEKSGEINLAKSPWQFRIGM
jgi:hypothetical protein